MKSLQEITRQLFRAWGRRQRRSRPAIRAAILSALSDPRRAVRISAIGSVINRGGEPLGPADMARFEWEVGKFAARAHLHEDDAGVQREFGVIELLAGKFDAAAGALQIGSDLEPDRPCR